MLIGNDVFSFCFMNKPGSTPTSAVGNDRYDLLHNGNKSTESDSPKSSSHGETWTCSLFTSFNHIGAYIEAILIYHVATFTLAIYGELTEL